MDALEGKVGEPWLHVVNASPRLSGFLLCLEYGLGALDKQVRRVLALNLWPCGEKFLMMNVPLSCHSRITSQNILIKSEVIPAILAVLVIVLDSD